MKRKYRIQQKVRAANAPEFVGIITGFIEDFRGNQPWYWVQWIAPTPLKRQIPEPEGYFVPFKLDKAARFAVA